MASNKSSSLNLTYVVIAAIIGFAILGYGFLNYQTKQGELKIKQDELQMKQDQIDLENQKTNNYQSCADEANKEATALLKSKLKIMPKDASEYEIYKKAAAEDMYLKPDYDSIYNKCLGQYGLK